MIEKEKIVRSKGIRDAARGQVCTLRLPCCRMGRETTIAAHIPHESHGMSRKASDLSIAFGCDRCHDAVDGRGNLDPITQGYIDSVGLDLILRRAMTDTYVALVDAGVIKISP